MTSSTNPSSFRKPVIRTGNKQRSGVIAALDIGSAKIACLIAETDRETGPVVKGIGQHASHGMRNGEVVDMEALSVAVGKPLKLLKIWQGCRLTKSGSVFLAGRKFLFYAAMKPKFQAVK